MAHVLVEDRMATRDEVRAHAAAIRRLADEQGLGAPRVRPDGAVVVHSDAPGYRAVNRLSTAASGVVGAYVHVLTDDVPGAVDTQPL